MTRIHLLGRLLGFGLMAGLGVGLKRKTHLVGLLKVESILVVRKMLDLRQAIT
jgi:hypothetical protein